MMIRGTPISGNLHIGKQRMVDDAQRLFYVVIY